MANTYKLVNQIRKISINGVLLKGNFAIKRGIADFYQGPYYDDSALRPDLDRLSFRSIHEGGSNLLERSFTEEEVVAALHSMSGDKA